MNTCRPQPRFPRHTRQRGAVLLVALIFLVLLTLLAIGASSGSLLQQRMVAATRNAQLATMSADTALRGAEWELWHTPYMAGGQITCYLGSINPSNGCVRYEPSSPLYGTTGAVTQFRTGDNKWLSLAGPITYKGPDGGEDYTTGQSKANLAQNPQYLIEDMGPVRSAAGIAAEGGDTGQRNSGPGKINLHIYRITARATGGNKNTVRVVQSTFDAQPTN
jgi:type IV pilus assembly protein PilX